MLKFIPKELAYAKDDLMHFAWSNEWLLEGRYEADPEKLKPFQLSFRKKNKQTVLNYFDDFIAGFPYYVLRGPEEEEEYQKIAADIEVYSLNEILELLHKPDIPEERAKAILQLGVSITGEFREDFFSEFLKALSDLDAKVRSAAIDACAYVGWAEFCEPLAQIKDSDACEEVRSQAESTLNALQMTEEERVTVVRATRGEGAKP